ncbi:MAG TPA: hypothetical protein V6C81_06695 [Planktothrix sp.]
MDKLAEWKRALAASGLSSPFGYTDAPWPIFIALFVFILMLLPFITYWEGPPTQQVGIGRQDLMQQVMQQQYQPQQYQQQYLPQQMQPQYAPQRPKVYVAH